MSIWLQFTDLLYLCRKFYLNYFKLLSPKVNKSVVGLYFLFFKFFQLRHILREYIIDRTGYNVEPHWYIRDLI